VGRAARGDGNPSSCLRSGVGPRLGGNVGGGLRFWQLGRSRVEGSHPLSRLRPLVGSCSRCGARTECGAAVRRVRCATHRRLRPGTNRCRFRSNLNSYNLFGVSTNMDGAPGIWQAHDPRAPMDSAMLVAWWQRRGHLTPRGTRDGVA